jgi:organic radical activating enzyme
MAIRVTPYVFFVDVVGTCNLRCPSCPIGNTRHNALPAGAMAAETLDAIVKKAKNELGYVAFHLYNWTEPLLHPRIGDLVRAVTQNGVACHLSSNLNVGKRIDDVAEAEPTSIRVSVSGFSQEIYSQTHKRGDIELVKENMRRLASAVAKRGGRTELNVYFHRYLGNHIEEAAMRSFSEGLGYNFETGWAYLMPLEKNIEFSEHGLGSSGLSDADRALINKLALPLADAIEDGKRSKIRDCSLRADQYALDMNGGVALCCSVYDSSDRVVGNYLDEPHSVLHARKYAH